MASSADLPVIRGLGDGAATRPGALRNGVPARPGFMTDVAPGEPVGRATGCRALGRAAALALLGALGACSGADAFLDAQLEHQLGKAGATTLDLGLVGPANWTRACVLGPYSTDARARELLGFDWAVEGRSDVTRRDDRFLLVFTDGRQVLGYVERQRAAGDFTTLQPPCVERAAARLALVPRTDGVRELRRVAAP